MSRQKVLLKDIANIVQGGRLKLSGHDFVETGYPAYGAGGLNGYLDQAEFDKAGIVLSSIGARCGKCFLPEGNWTSLANTQVIFPDQEKADVKYLWYQLNDEERWPRSGSAQPFIKPSDVKAHEIYLPDLTEQRRIVAILDKADALRVKRREAIAKLDQLLQSVFLDMFGDPIINPRGLPTATLEEASDQSDRINYGVVQPGQDFAEGIPLVRIGDILGGKLDVASIKRIDPKIDSVYVRSRLKGNELLISCVGSIGTVAMVPEEAIGFNIARAITRVPLKNPDQRAFVQSCLRSQGVQRYFQEKTRTVSQPTLNVEFVKQAQILVPPMEEQERFARIAARAEQRKHEMRKSTRQLDILFASLKYRAFSGTL